MAQGVLAVQRTSECEADVLRSFDRTLRSGHLDAIVIGCRVQPELARRVAQRESYRASLRAILGASNDEPLARAAGLHIPRTNRRADGLSPRELEVYELMIQGRTNREIAGTLFITESTTKVHVRHILEKLGVRSRVEAVRAWRPTAGAGSDLADPG
jgi:DNA-binding NarL/FixJ family response regulator